MSTNGANSLEVVLHNVRVEVFIIAGAALTALLIIDGEAADRTYHLQIATTIAGLVVSVAMSALQFRTCQNWLACLDLPRGSGVVLNVIGVTIGTTHAYYALPVFVDPLIRDTLELLFPVSIFGMWYATTMTTQYLPIVLFCCALSAMSILTICVGNAEWQHLLEAVCSLLPNAAVYLVVATMVQIRLRAHRRQAAGQIGAGSGTPQDAQDAESAMQNERDIHADGTGPGCLPDAVTVEAAVQEEGASDAGSRSSSSACSNAPTLIAALRLTLATLLPANAVASVWSSAGSRTSTTAVCEEAPDSEVWASVARLRRPDLHRVSTPVGSDGTPEMYLCDSPDSVLAEEHEAIDQVFLVQVR